MGRNSGRKFPTKQALSAMVQRNQQVAAKRATLLGLKPKVVPMPIAQSNWVNVNTFASTAATTSTYVQWYSPTTTTANPYSSYAQQQFIQTPIYGSGSGVQNPVDLAYDLSDAQLTDLAKRRGARVLFALTHALPLIPTGIIPKPQIGTPSRQHYGYRLPSDLDGAYLLPDGSVLRLDQHGNYTVEDQNAKVTYKANRIREFNPYISASDLLEAFIGDAGRHGVDQGELLALPVESFINWLVRKAAEKDGDAPPAGLPPMLALPNPNPPPVLPRCVACGRFLRRAWAAARLTACSPEHYGRALLRLPA